MTRTLLLLTLSAGSACSPAAEQSRILVGEDAFPPATEPMVDDRVTTDNGWPRLVTGGSLQITMYQPQVESWDGDRIRSRVAVAVRTAASALPSYGIVELSARTEVDRENRLVTLNEIRVDDASFPSQPGDAEELTAAIRRSMPTGGVYVALDRLEASLAVSRAESKHPTVHVRNDVPRIVFSTTPAVLVLVDGQPVLRPGADTSLLRVINTRALLVFDPRGGDYYLSLAGRWLRSGEVTGPWAEARDLPPSTAVALDRIREGAARNGLVDLLDTAGTPVVEEFGRGEMPTVYVSTVPAELMQTQGAPQLQAIPGTRLLDVENSASDIFVNTADQLYYVLLSGRWTAARPSSAAPGHSCPRRTCRPTSRRFPRATRGEPSWRRCRVRRRRSRRSSRTTFRRPPRSSARRPSSR